MDTDVFQQLHNDGLITTDEHAAIARHEETKLFSLHWDLRSLLYSGILMLAAGIGILIYKHIDAIGHLTVVILTGLLSAGCIGYCFKTAPPFHRNKVESPNLWFDYILLLGCMLMVTFLGYLQFQFHIFGLRWGMATFIPMLLLFAMAYYFDHKGVLSMAITALGAWLGVAIEPIGLLRSHDLTNENYVWSGVILGVTLTILYILSGYLNIKAHFAPVYKNFGIHILMITLICAMFVFGNAYWLWFLVLLLAGTYHFIDAVRHSSFYFLLFTVLYGYFGLSGFLIELLIKADAFSEGTLYLIIIYFICSAIGITMTLRHFNHQFNRNDSIQ